MKKLTFLLIALLFLVSCSLSESEIEKIIWKYDSGFRYSDVESFDVRGDTLILRSRPVGLITSAKRKFGKPKELIFIELRTEEIGQYVRLDYIK